MNEQALKDEFPEVEEDQKEELENAEEEQQEPEATAEETQETEEPEVQTVEEEARGHGWKPYDEWVAEGNDPNEWTGAQKFLAYGRLIRANRHLKKQTEDMEGRFHRLEKFKQYEIEQERQKLQQQKKEAVELADVDKFEQLEKQERELNQQHQQMEAPAYTPEQLRRAQIIQQILPQPEMQSFINNNPEIMQNPEMGEQVIPLMEEFTRANPDKFLGDALQYVEQKLKPMPTSNPNRDNAKIPDKGKPRGTVKKRLTMNDLTHTEKKFYEEFRGEMPQKEFLQMVEDSRKSKND